MVSAKKALKSTLLKTKNKQKTSKNNFRSFLFIFYYFYTSTASNKAKRSATSASVKLYFLHNGWQDAGYILMSSRLNVYVHFLLKLRFDDYILGLHS